MTQQFVFSSSDIFKERPDDPENVDLVFPPEVLETLNWKPGDVLNIKVEDQTLVITKNE